MVDSFPGYPCRVSLEDARVGERVLLLCYPYHEVNSPYRAAGPIFIREHAIMAEPLINHIPAMLKVRPQSVRAYDQSGHMLAAEVVVGEDLKPAIIRQLENPHIQYLHLHNAGPGCFNCTVMRA